jgi:hypothetical protein
MKALVIAPQPFFSARGTPFSVYYRTMLMAESGVSIDLLTYGQGEDVDLPGVRVIRTPALGWLGTVRVGPSALKLLHDTLIVLWAMALLLRNRYDFVHAHEESIFVALLFKPLFQYQLVYDMHSSLPQQLENFQYTSSRLLIRLFERLEEASLTSADAVITICPATSSSRTPSSTRSGSSRAGALPPRARPPSRQCRMIGRSSCISGVSSRTRGSICSSPRSPVCANSTRMHSSC